MKPFPFVLALAFFCGSKALALPSMAPKIREGEIRVGLSANGYLSNTRPSISDEKTGNASLSVATRATGKKNDFRFGIEADSLYGLRNSNYRYLSIPEAYVGYEKESLNLYFGRKRLQWSELDSYWGLGIFQPRFRWDYLNERESGLVGLFLGHSSRWLQVNAFWSPLFAPEQGAPFTIAGGDCKTSSPWFACPTASMQLFNQPTDVKFLLEVPSIQKLIQKPAYGITVRAGQSTGFYGRASFTHKPLNQFLLSYEGRLDLSTLQIPSIIRPRRQKANSLSFDFGYAQPRLSAVSSLIIEAPIRDLTYPAWNTQETARALLLGTTLKAMPFEKAKHTRVEFSFFRRHGGNGDDIGPFVTPGTNIFEPRYAFKNAFSFSMFSPIFDEWARKFLFSSRFVWDTENQGNILQADVYYAPWSRIFFQLGIDLLGSENRNPVDFISRYQRNDRIRGGIAYAF